MTGHIAQDLLLPFKIERTSLRGRFVRLGSVLDRILQRQNYPGPVNNLLGELIILASVFAGSMKFNGMFSLQIRGTGPISLMVADCTNEGVMRGYAHFDAEALDGLSGSALFGDAVLAITIDQSAFGSETYQGIVEVSPGGLTDSVRGYFMQSEQVPSGLKLAFYTDPADGSWAGSALLLQALPDSGLDGRDDDWRRTMLLMQTISEDELLDQNEPPHSLLWRVFHEDGVRVFDTLLLSDGCRCDEERVMQMLSNFEAEELSEMQMEDGAIVVTCQFCGQEYRYEEPDVRVLIRQRSH